MDVNEMIFNSTQAIFSQFGLDILEVEKTTNDNFINCDDVTVLLGFSGSVNGNMIFGFDTKTTDKFLDILMGEYKEDLKSENSLQSIGEIFTMVVGHLTQNLNTNGEILFAPPSIVAGTDTVTVLGCYSVERLTLKSSCGDINILYYLN